jgi:hypothetical protein
MCIKNMPFSKPTLLSLATVFVALVLAGGALVLFSDSGQSKPDPRERRPSLAVAILGDSDSHSFQDNETFPPSSPERGGKYRSATFNWPEILVRLRGDQIDLGEWRIWGPHKPIAKAREILGLPVRRPRKEDYQYNFAINGAGCKDLNTGWRQVDRLLSVIALEPEHWRNGIVVIRIGVNSFGQTPHLEEVAKDPDAPSVNAAMRNCIGAIRQAVERLRSREPRLRFVLVGIFDNAQWAKNLEKWHSPQELANISTFLDRFDNALVQFATSDANLAFFDDRAWFEKHWGSRNSAALPAYQEVVLANGLHVSNSSGDHPSNAVVADGHAGTAWNALWVQALVELINDRFGASIRPINENEIAGFVDPAASR